MVDSRHNISKTLMSKLDDRYIRVYYTTNSTSLNI